LAVVESRIHDITTEARKRLQGLLDMAQNLSLSRYELIDTLGRLERELLGGQQKDTAEEVAGDGIAEPESSASDPLSVLRRLEAVHARMDELARSMRWIAVLEQVAVLRYVPISPAITAGMS
jgi:hypothetical protein